MWKIEQAIEEMTQEGYLIDQVKVLTPVDCSTPQWIPLEELEELPNKTEVQLWGKRPSGNIKIYIAACDDMRWLIDWWKGGWQANI